MNTTNQSSSATSDGPVLFLGPPDSTLLAWLRNDGNESVIDTTDKLTVDFVKSSGVKFLVSYGYRHILRSDILDLFTPNRAVNLHISYLPYNRGADPNLWSFVENTPKGVTIHYLDTGVDTGDIIVQREVVFSPQENTLAATYARLHSEIQDLFRTNWPAIKNGSCQRIKQDLRAGSEHKIKDKEALSTLLVDGWNTTLEKIAGSRRV